MKMYCFDKLKFILSVSKVYGDFLNITIFFSNAIKDLPF